MRNGQPVPPPHIVKQEFLLYYAKQYKLITLVETGTYQGLMIQAVQNHFKEIFSVEINEHLYENADQRFKLLKHITIIHGDSNTVLAGIVKNLTQPALFWLDGHYSGGITSKGDRETPIVEELRHILSDSRYNHVILIDDARLFGSALDYPDLEQLEILLRSYTPKALINVETDIIRILPEVS